MFRLVHGVSLKQHKHNWDTREASNVIPMNIIIIPRETEAAVVWAHGKERRAGSVHATCAQHHRTCERVERKTIVKIYEYNHGEYENGWNGEGC